MSSRPEALTQAPLLKVHSTRSRWTSVVHPLLFAASFVLFLFAQNLEEQVSAGVVLMPLLLVLLATTGGFLLALVAFRDVNRAGLATSISVLLFLTYGHVWQLVQAMVDERVLLAAWIVLLVLGLALIARAHAVPSRISDGLGVMAGVLVAMNVLPIVAYQTAAPSSVPANRTLGLEAGPDAHTVKRDIYFLVLDRYPAEQTLRDQYGFDNRPFIDALERRGFYVATDSFANYGKTAFSLVGTLEMEYLDMPSLRAQAVRDADWKPVFELLKGPLAVPAFLKSQGYRYIHVAYWQGTLTNELADQVLAYSETSEFASVLYDTSVLRAVGIFEVEAELDGRDLRRNQTLYQFARLQEMSGAPGPKFVFAHILMPHDPYVFDADGNFLSEAAARERPLRLNFVEHVQYTNQRMLEIIDRLQDVPPSRQPIIVLAADEGPFPDRFAGNQDTFEWADATADEVSRKFRILNTLYLPDAGSPGLYPSISPINTFRVIFNTYFDTDLPLLPDRAFVFVNGSQLYNQFEITDRLLGESQ